MVLIRIEWMECLRTPVVLSPDTRNNCTVNRCMAGICAVTHPDLRDTTLAGSLREAPACVDEQMGKSLEETMPKPSRQRPSTLQFRGQTISNNFFE